MTDDVKAKRRYDSSRRQQQAEQTRLDVLAAAQELFVEHGYAATTLAAVAKRAGVVVETVYRAFGSKAKLFHAVVRAAVAGGAERAKVDPEERPAIRLVIDEPDPVRKLALYAKTQPGIHRRSGPLLRALDAAAAADPMLAELAGQIDEERLIGQRRFADHLAGGGHLREGLEPAEAGDVLSLLTSRAVHDQLVLQRGWSADKYRDWLADTLTRLLL